MPLDFSPEQQALINSYTREAGVSAAPFIETAHSRLERLQAQAEVTGQMQNILTIGGGGISNPKPEWFPWIPRAALLQSHHVVNIDPARQSQLDLRQPNYHALSGSSGDIAVILRQSYQETIHKLQSLLPDPGQGYSVIIADHLLGQSKLAPELFARMISEGSDYKSIDANRDSALLGLREKLKQAAAELLSSGGILAIDEMIFRAHDQHLYKVEGF